MVVELDGGIANVKLDKRLMLIVDEDDEGVMLDEEVAGKERGILGYRLGVELGEAGRDVYTEYKLVILLHLPTCIITTHLPHHPV